MCWVRFGQFYLLRGCGWGGDSGSLTGPVALSLDDDLVGVVGEAIEGALGEDRVIEEGDPLVDTAVGCDDRGAATVTLDNDLIEVTGLLCV